ncbi:hypothetical protein [Fibrivirga algicola]|uniref:Protein BatD n=1 Tax=Fibrivirga algicola TaxID=2950420 RepID=A0ABX0QNT2_9BACT|nr:hypothetical protein [Fibrivirga algicola]ARK09340.1 hypothetical protein A6C57_02795 [Fibrella sp. ES10-3-2-2]NID13816.1 hypothetical protein [Fibrivirga algicola]
MINYSRLALALIGWLLSPFCLAQDPKPLQIILPQQSDWTVVAEGQAIQFTLKTTGSAVDSISYSIAQGMLDGMSFDSLGHFSWTPSYDLADRLKTTRTVPVIFEVRNRRGESATQLVEFRVNHVNRRPVVEDLPPFYVRFQTQNVYKFDPKQVYDADGDPIAFVAIPDQMPEGMKLSAQGELTWTLSRNQFNQLRGKPVYIEFWVEDQPAKSRTKGRLKIDVTQMDLPPVISVVPKERSYRVRENSTINLKFYLADPNGDDDIEAFDFLSSNQLIPKSALVKNTNNQYEFIWMPGYEFVRDPHDTLRVNLTFFVLDKAQNRDEQTIAITVVNTVNEDAKDRYTYALYNQALVQAWNLVTQLDEKEIELKRDYRRAKGGKRNRSMANASLGAVTGISPAVNSNNQRLISAIGGTAVLTMGTLEATEVIGKSMKDLLDRYNYVLGKKTELQNKGDVFAREFALKSARRTPDFIKKLDEFRNAMSLSGLVSLELDANWQNKKEATDKALKRTFKDFTPLDEAQ